RLCGKNENTYFFATNIQSKDYSNGSSASKITLSILNDKKSIILNIFTVHSKNSHNFHINYRLNSYTRLII
ncbi:hypothetical protein BM533_00390, partial [Clostridioides difficile]